MPPTSPSGSVGQGCKLKASPGPLPNARELGQGGRGQPHPGGAPGSWQSHLEPLEAAANDSSPTAPTPPPQTHPGTGNQAHSPPQPCLQPFDPSSIPRPHSPQKPSPSPTPNHLQDCNASHFLLFIQKKKKSFKYNLRIPPSTGVCLWFPPPPHPRPPHSLMDTAWGSVGAGRCLGVVAGPRHYSGNRHDNESVSPRGKGGNNKTGPPHPNTDSYDKDRRKTKQGTTTKNGCGGGEEEK